MISFCGEFDFCMLFSKILFPNNPVNCIRAPTQLPEEWATILAHVRAADFPEPPSVWAQLGRDAGFHDVRDLFTDPIGLYTVFCFRP
jgi:hypothetical protein